jgi:HPt (histidine-containing phosphotransfer) domain-containing protein
MNDKDVLPQELRLLNREMYAPLHSAMHAASSLADTHLDDEQRHHLNIVEASIRVLRGLIERVADTQRRPAVPARETEASQPMQTGLDLGILHRLRGIDEKERVGLFEELIFGFLEQSTDKQGEIARLISERNRPRIVQAAHTLKGMSLNFGAVNMAKECERLQRMAESDREEDLASALARIKEVFALTREALIKSLKSQGSKITT